MSLARKITSEVLAWLYRPKNRLMCDPVYARLTREIAAAQRAHRNARALREQRRQRLHRLLAGSGQ